MKGKCVISKDGRDRCERILNDEFKDFPESGLYMIGAIGEAKKPVKSDSASTESGLKPAVNAPEKTKTAPPPNGVKLKPTIERNANAHES